MIDRYSVRRVESDEDGDEPVTRFYLYEFERPIAVFNDAECWEADSKRTLEALSNYWGLLDAVRTLVFLVGQMPAAKTIHDQELNRAYSSAADFLRDEHERRIIAVGLDTL
jgi:hypothetical protein